VQYGLTEQTLANILKVFAQHPEIQQAILYGSRAKGNYRAGSDIDITLKGSQLDKSLLFDVLEALDQLNLPYEIDLSIYKQIENADLHEHIERVGKVIYLHED
jgi:predicted nucleotidyltransferase